MNRFLVAGRGVALGLACIAAQAASLDVPAPLRAAEHESLVGTLAARGVQIYECRVSATGAQWAFVAPDADLFDADGRVAGRHGAGPIWEAADGSRVVGTVKAHADAPAAGAVPWLLLATRAAGPQGRFSAVTSIQRVNTAGGLAPSAPCTVETQGATARVDYTADYRLFASENRK
jgi:hypothetical protein